MKSLLHYLTLTILGLFFSSMLEAKEIKIKSDNINRLVSESANYSGGVKNYATDFAKNFWAEGWNSSSQTISWDVVADERGIFQATIFANANIKDANEVSVILSSSAGSSIETTIKTDGWQQFIFADNILLPKGKSTVTLKIKGDNNISIQLFSLELTAPKIAQSIEKRALKLRSDVSWMNEIPYGMFFHWNASSMPLKGEPSDYQTAVNNFDVDKFASMVNECGGRLVFFTTSWAKYYFPAPIKAIDNILEGRTAKRDLIADLSDALAKYDIKLIIYYHLGHGDKEWWERQNYKKGEAETLFANLENILYEISNRYGKKLAGFWLDDAMAYYPNNAPFEKLTIAAKSGNKDIVLCYNPWIFPRMTEFQDFFAGEIELNANNVNLHNKYLPVGGNGIFNGGPHKGLKATYTGRLEPNEWAHIYKDKEIDSPSLTEEELVSIINQSIERKNLPMINLRIYQNGDISPDSYQLMRKLNQAIK